MIKSQLGLSCLLLLFSISLWAQTQSDVPPSVTKTIATDVQTTYAEYLGKTPPIRQLIPLAATTREYRKVAKRNFKKPQNFIGRGRQTVVHPELEHQGPDQLRQTHGTNTLNNKSLTPVEPFVNINGITSGSSPNDPSGDIGLDHYVQAINLTTIGVFNKQGLLLNTFTGNSLWNSIGFSSRGDPIVLFDQEAQKWIITEFPIQNQLLIAVSETSDPLGSYNAYNFATPAFPDYPKYGIWDNAYTVTTNEFFGGGLSCYLIDRPALLAGEETVSIQRITVPGNNNTEAGFFVATPVDWSGLTTPSSDPIFMRLHDSSWGGISQDGVQLYSVNVDFDSPSNTTIENTTVFLSPYDGYPCSVFSPGFACVPQQGTTQGLDAIPELVMNQPHYRNFETHESLVFNFITDVTNGDNLSGIRWVELRKSGGSDWELYQEGTYAPDDGLDRFMGCSAIDGKGNIALGFNVTSDTSFVGVRYTGRRVNDPLGEMTVEEFNAVEGSNRIFAGGRFGDYAHMSIDPVNDRTFWFTTEYAGGGDGNTNTRIVSFEINRDTIDIGPLEILSPQTSTELGATEIVQVDFKNFGLDTHSVFQIGYILDDNPPIIEDINFTLYPDSVYRHNFTTTADLDEIRDYDLKVFSFLAEDQAIFNDTIRSRITKIPTTDAGISNIEGSNNANCGDETELLVTYTNFGGDTINSLDINVELNGAIVQTINWSGALAPSTSNDTLITVAGLIDGENMIIISTANPNNTIDEVESNDAFNRTISAFINSVDMVLEIRTDFNPMEITWELTDEDDNIVFEGGPYTEVITFVREDWCLAPGKCYSFTIFDSGNNGICCSNGPGRYAIYDAFGSELLTSDGNYGAMQTYDFCTETNCLLEAAIDITPLSTSTSMDGVIMITAANGVGNVEYSIDGGQSFQSENTFTNLDVGSYDVVTKDSIGCTVEETVSVDFGTAVNNLSNKYNIEVFPNPTEGVFRINLTGIDYPSVFLPIEIYDAQSKRVQSSRLVKYDDTYTGELSLYDFSSGIYFVRFQHKEINQMIRIVRK